MQSAEIYTLVGNFAPYEYQDKLWNLLTGDEFKSLAGITLLSGTGSGKTEAVMLPALFGGKRLVMVYPTRSLVDDQIGRARNYIKAGIEGGKFPEKTLIIDLGNRKQAYKIRKFDKERDLNLIREKLLFWYNKVDSDGNRLLKTVSVNGTKFERPVPDDMIDIIKKRLNFDKFEIEVNISPWTSINIEESNGSNMIVYEEKKHYYGGDIILSTLDEFLFRFLGYGGRHNLLYPYRLIWGHRAKQDLIVAFDEAHSYENVAYTNFINLISSLVSHGIRSIVMSATLPDDFVTLAKHKFGFSFIKGEDFAGKKKYEIVPDEKSERNEQILENINKNSGKKVIVVRNTVKNAFDIFNTLVGGKKEYQFKDIPVFLYHGRLFTRPRNEIYLKVKKLDGNGLPYILITTHAIEVGCDLDSEVLITDFCNPDQLIQRAGRCARRRGEEGRIHIIGEDFSEHDRFLRNPDIEYEEYVNILKKGLMDGVLPQEQIREETIRPKLEKDELSDALFSFLSAFIYDFDRNREELHNSGFVITRSWTPSVKFCWLHDYEISDLRKLFAEKDTLSEVMEYLKQNGLLCAYDELCISLELMSSQEIDKRALKDKVLVVSYSNSKALDRDVGEGPLDYSRINPYIDDILVFYNGREFPNHNPIGTGLINVPKVFERSVKGIFVELTTTSQVLLDRSKKLRMRYLVPSPED